MAQPSTTKDEQVPAQSKSGEHTSSDAPQAKKQAKTGTKTVGPSDAPAKHHPVASDTPSTLTLSGVSIAVVSGKPGAWSFKGIDDGAYVMCRQETNRNATMCEPKFIRYGRTVKQGWVVEVEESEIDEEPKPTRYRDAQVVARDDLMMLYPDERYRLFWTFDKEHFDDVKAGLGALHDLEPSEVGSLEFNFVRQKKQDLTKLDLLDWLEDEKLLDAHCRSILETQLLNPTRGYSYQSTTDPDEPVAKLDATPAPFRALLLVEFLQWYALKAAERSGPDLALLYRAASLINAVGSGAPDAMMEEEVDRRYAKRTSKEREVFEKYRVYAWKAAAAHRKRDEFISTLPSRLAHIRQENPDLGWQDRAIVLRDLTADGSAGAAIHPGLDPAIQQAPAHKQDDLRFKLLLAPGLGLELVAGYFDLYALGVQFRDGFLEGRGSLLGPLIAAFDKEWEDSRNHQLPRQCQKILERHAPYFAFATALLQLEGNIYKRATLLERYLDSSALCEHTWWSTLQESTQVDAETSLWKHLSPRVKWIAEAFKGTGKTLSGLVEARLSAYTLIFKESHALLEGLFRHEIALSSTDKVNPQVHYISRMGTDPGGDPNFTARVDLEGGKITVTRDVPFGDAPHRLTLPLLERYERPAKFSHGPIQNVHAYRIAQRVSAKYSMTVDVPIDLAELKQRHTLLPKGFASCAEALNIARAVTTIADNLRHDKSYGANLEPAWDLAKGVISLLDSNQAALKAMQRPLEASAFLKASTLTGIKLVAASASTLDGVLKIGKGCTLLFGEEGDLAYELKHGRDGRAAVQTAKGLLQIAQGAVGIVAALPATGGLAATPIGLMLVIGSGLLVATADIVLDMTQPFGDQASAFQRAVDGAKKRELALRNFRASLTMQNAMTAVGACV